MFANSQIQTRARLAAANNRQQKTTSINTENNVPKPVKDAKSNNTVVRKENVVVKKRAALGDVSNLKSNIPVESKARAGVKSKKPVEISKKPVEVSKKIVKKDEPETKKERSTIPLPKAVVVKKTIVVERSQVIKETKSRIKKVIEPEVPVEQPVAKKFKTQDWDDLDAEDGYDPCMLAEYVVEIFEYMKKLEQETLPNENYMENQKELHWKMRTILVDWLIEVHNKFHLLPETLYLAVNILDRFLSRRVVALVKLQLVGLTAMFIASKYEEVMSPSITNFIYMADGGYSDEEVLKAERYVLQVLEFNLQFPSPMSFLRRCSKADSYDHQTRTLAKYLMEITLLDHQCLGMPPSMISAAGLCLSRRMLKRGEWDRNLVHYSGYEEEELEQCMKLIVDSLKVTKQDSLFKKYSSRKFMKASIFVKDWIEKHVVVEEDEFEADEAECNDEEEE